MALFASLIGAVFLVFGLLGVAIPTHGMAFLHSRRVALFPMAVIGRALLGLLLILTAPHCRVPVVILVIGIASLAAAVVLLAVGRVRFAAFIEGWLKRPPGLVRLLAVVAVALGWLLVWASGWPS
jgi:hypothetical protein